MHRTACVDLPAFPLQLLLRRHPDWQGHPAAVIDSDKPQGILLWVNERARAFRILPGMRYAAALSLAAGLRAAVVSSNEIERAVASLGRGLRRFTPGVEPSRKEPGIFWLDASGLERLHDSLKSWAGGIRSELCDKGFQSSVVVGFSRFGSYAVARARRRVLVFGKPDDERAEARNVPLDRLGFEPAIRDALDKLGVRNVGAFADLPAEGIEKRFGSEARRLHRLASDELHVPLQPERPDPPPLERCHLDHPEADVSRLMRVIERLMRSLLVTLVRRGQVLTCVQVGFCFERMGDHIECLRPAAPTLDAAQLLNLVRLRLEALRKLPDRVSEIVLTAEGLKATREQLQLFVERPRRDLAAAGRALARIRAELGNDAVMRARLRDGHLPEARFGWDTSIEEVRVPKPRTVDTGRLIRRIYVPSVPLPSRPRHEPDGWMLRDLRQGPVVRVLGPYVVSGGWWRHTVHREYHFAETGKGEMLWVYYDRMRRRWFMQGRVE